MLNILFARTFLIVGLMLLLSSVASRLNKAFETSWEFWVTFFGTFTSLIVAFFVSDYYPYSFIALAIFSWLIGWSMGPAIEHIGLRFKVVQYFKSKGILIDRKQTITPEQYAEFKHSDAFHQFDGKWRTIIFQTMLATTVAVFSTALTVFLTDINFSLLGSFLFIALLVLVFGGLLNVFLFRSNLLSLAHAYVGAFIFTLYLLFDFHLLERSANDSSWGNATRIAIKIYLDIINLFLDLLRIIADASS